MEGPIELVPAFVGEDRYFKGVGYIRIGDRNGLDPLLGTVESGEGDAFSVKADRFRRTVAKGGSQFTASRHQRLSDLIIHSLRQSGDFDGNGQIYRHSKGGRFALIGHSQGLLRFIALAVEPGNHIGGQVNLLAFQVREEIVIMIVQRHLAPGHVQSFSLHVGQFRWQGRDLNGIRNTVPCGAEERLIARTNRDLFLLF